MSKTIFEEMGGAYVRQGDYNLPCLSLPTEKENRLIGVWGQRHLRYLKQHRKVLYTNLLTSGKLDSYLADINEQAEDMFLRLVEQMVNREGVTEQLKMENQMEWVGKMNNIHSRSIIRIVDCKIRIIPQAVNMSSQNPYTSRVKRAHPDTL